MTDRGTAPAIVATGLTKRYGDVTAVEDLSFEVRSGAVTGFLGPNGAGKTTTLRMVLGLARPTAGSSTILGRPFTELPEPAHSVGANLEICGMHPGRSGRNHLRALAAFAGLPASRVDEVLDLVEMRDAADRRAGGYSTGMRQRLGLAATLLGDPEVLVLDEPANGLDPQGIRWLRDFLRGAAAEGRTVLVSSHVLSEVEQTVDDVVVIHRGRLVKSGPIASLITGDGRPRALAQGRRARRRAGARRGRGPRRRHAAHRAGAHDRRGRRPRLRHRRARARARRGGRLARGGLLPPDQRPGSERADVSRLDPRRAHQAAHDPHGARASPPRSWLLTLAIVLLTILAGDPKTIADKRSALAVGSSISALLLVFGVVGAGAEYRHRTLAPALLVAPGRGRLLAARVVAYGARRAGHRHRHDASSPFAIGVPLLAGQPGPDLGAERLPARVRRRAGGHRAVHDARRRRRHPRRAARCPPSSGRWSGSSSSSRSAASSATSSKFTVGQTATSLGGDTGGDVLPWGAAFLVMLAWTAVFLLAAALVDGRRDIA